MDARSFPNPSARLTVDRQPAAAGRWAAAKGQPAAEGPMKERTAASADGDDSPSELRDAFRDFVGQTLFGSLLASMRKTVGKTPYLHGGRTEEVFQQQLDRHIVQDLTESSADSLADPMYELFHLQRR